MFGNSAYLTKVKESIMDFKKIMKKFRQIAEQNADSAYDNIWLQRSKPTDDGYENQTTSLNAMLDDKSDEFIYNVWARATEEGLAEMDNFVETELLPKGLRLLEDTELVSKDNGSVRYMIARSNMTS